MKQLDTNVKAKDSELEESYRNTDSLNKYLAAKELKIEKSDESLPWKELQGALADLVPCPTW